jgi:hypothetical protein
MTSSSIDTTPMTSPGSREADVVEDDVEHVPRSVGRLRRLEGRPVRLRIADVDVDHALERLAHQKASSRQWLFRRTIATPPRPVVIPWGERGASSRADDALGPRIGDRSSMRRPQLRRRRSLAYRVVQAVLVRVLTVAWIGRMFWRGART